MTGLALNIVVVGRILCSLLTIAADGSIESKEKEFVLTLDHTNFIETVSKHNFMAVEFYAPWCGHCKHLALEYEKATSISSKHYPSVFLANVDVNEEANRNLASEYGVRGYPTLKIF
ncbi:hypothetical protein F3Y22_tig00110410pilonHSYRG00019 [Hibiscus syriacus]|uniref:protein disulfide-isomerase n=1 Tax=Hibiscus syriacus TaxID=106335 RepID=A0A6A3AQA1_HIBSY|nr:hypothetical protein F3Y22_tig00110410pilonHSYRG00019 [Hibiscus syriacus]